MHSLITFAQLTPTELAAPIVAEGKLLYRSEMASWYGTDLFLENYKNRTNIGGYFSYTDNEISKCIFYSKTKTPKVIGTISFDSTYNTGTAKTDLSERAFTKMEEDLFIIRQLAAVIMKEDTLFKSYENTNFNLIPFIYNNAKSVYILTGPTGHGVVIFGNDYLISFNNDNKYVNKKQLHKNIISVGYATESGENTDVVGAMHTHTPETGDFITATDICTLMLYEKFAKWKQHIVVSEKYMNLWNCETNSLIVLPKEIVDSIDQEKTTRKKKKNKTDN